MSETVPTNPYDFRLPIHQLHLLAGRTDELARIDELMRAAAAGRPTHLSLFGNEGCGKSSLLIAAAEIGRARGLLPIHVTLRSALVASEVQFYREMLDTGLQTLVALGHLQEDSDVLRVWLRQTRAGEAAVVSGVPTFEVGLMTAAALSGKLGTDVPIPALQRDLALLLRMAPSASFRGIVLCFDNAEYLDNSLDIAQSLAALSSPQSQLALLTASTIASELQAVAPRAWEQIEVKPFADAPAVFEAMTKPLEFVQEHGLAPNVSTARDVRALTRGHPYEVNLVCHFIWDAIRSGEQTQFELSPPVIERLLTELEQKGRHASSSAISRLSELTSAEYEALFRVAPYEALTVRQMALIR